MYLDSNEIKSISIVSITTTLEKNETLDPLAAFYDKDIAVPRYGFLINSLNLYQTKYLLEQTSFICK